MMWPEEKSLVESLLSIVRSVQFCYSRTRVRGWGSVVFCKVPARAVRVAHRVVEEVEAPALAHAAVVEHLASDEGANEAHVARKRAANT
eukprot:6205279-Pleurochrysis_carterae.AAC.2